MAWSRRNAPPLPRTVPSFSSVVEPPGERDAEIVVMAPDHAARPPHRARIREKQNKVVGHQRIGLKPDAAAALRHIQQGAGTKWDARASVDQRREGDAQAQALTSFNRKKN